MHLTKRLAQAWLRVPERGVDIISILLASTGINIVTAAPGNAHAVVVLLSGLAITCAGIATIMLKYRTRSIWLSVESKLETDKEAAVKYLETGATGTKPEPKSSATHLTDTISDFLEHSPDSGSVTRNLLLATILALAGLVAAFWPVFAPQRPEENKVQQQLEAIEKTVQSLNHEIARVSSESATSTKRIAAQTLAVNELKEAGTNLIIRLEHHDSDTKQIEQRSANALKEAETNLIVRLENQNLHAQKSLEELRLQLRELVKSVEVSKEGETNVITALESQSQRIERELSQFRVNLQELTKAVKDDN